MPTTNQTNDRADTFAARLTDTTDLGLAMLVAESGEGHYQPITIVSSIREAQEMANADMEARVTALDGGAEPMCPHRYVVWARGADGTYTFARGIDAN